MAEVMAVATAATVGGQCYCVEESVTTLVRCANDDTNGDPRCVPSKR